MISFVLKRFFPKSPVKRNRKVKGHAYGNQSGFVGDTRLPCLQGQR